MQQRGAVGVGEQQVGECRHVVLARQVWLQHLPPDQVLACGPDLFFMVENFPLTRTLQNLFKGSGQCAEVTWRFLGLSLAGYNVLISLALAVVAIFAGVVALKNRPVEPE